MELTNHFEYIREERGIQKAWVERTVQQPDRIEDKTDGTRHYLKLIQEYGNRWLRVVINVSVEPNRGVTVFFDRRLRSKGDENQSR
jgi:hypothetical protein